MAAKDISRYSDGCEADKLAWLRSAVAEGLESLDRGEAYTFEQVMEYARQPDAQKHAT